MKFILYLLIITSSVFALPKSHHKQETCGYSSCPEVDSNVLNVHIVPHSHDDVGWLKTVDQYYYGNRQNIQHAGVQYILDSVIQALLKDPERRFIYVETAFFWKWWQEQTEDMREQVKHLVDTGRLEIIGGAWSMNDEAASHYHSTIDQFTWGFRKLEETLGKCARPKIGWQIDPFGHSREMASLFTQFGFDGLFFARLDWRDKNKRLAEKTAEMLWQGSQSLGSSSQLFTSILYNHYMTPPGFCFDVMCPDDPIIDNKNSPEYNAEARANVFLNYVKQQARNYRSNNVIITMGGDFHYQDAMSYFINMDRLIKAVRNLNTNTRIFYSTPSCYLKAVHAENLKWSVKTDDFFPYASDPHSYWSGYFTSRPTSKRFERLGNNFLQVAKQLAVLTGESSSVPALDPLREAMGVMQHHDAITGTEKQHVADDYARIMSEAINTADEFAGKAVKQLYGPDGNFQSCLLLNISQCELTENDDTFIVNVYNPLSRPVSKYVRLPVTKRGHNVINEEGNRQDIQYVPVFDMLANVPGRKSSAKEELVFYADSIPPLGYRSFAVSVVENFIEKKYEEIKEKARVSFQPSGHIKHIRVGDKQFNIQQDFLYYSGASGNNMVFENRSSGAYIFRPKTQQATPVSESVQTTTHAGSLVTEYHMKFNDWVGQVIRVYEKYNHIEVQWIVGPIPVEDKIGKEIISRYSTNINSTDVFYTDSNGREMLKRIRDYRETFPLTHEEPVAQNYYPVTSKILIKDENTGERFAVLNDRAQGGTSLQSGEVELMLHRRLLHDDAFGVGEALNERAYGTGLVATGTIYLHYGSSEGSSSVAEEKYLAQSILLSPWIFIQPMVQANSNSLTDYNFKFSGLKKPLPNNVQILTLEPWGDNTVLLRLEHIFEKDEDATLSSPVSVNIASMFSTFNVLEMNEMALGANQLASAVSRLQWNAQNGDESNIIKKETIERNNMEVTLLPMEIKTFILKVKHVQ
ncbi:Lysosomal alpha-mannosidase II [Carabus blaptoides fortunei]